MGHEGPIRCPTNGGIMRFQTLQSDSLRLMIAQPAADIGALMGAVQPVTALLKALSHETRFIVLCQLAEGEKTVGELEQLLQLRQPALSQQLARLREDGLVGTRRKGRNIYYRLASPPAREIIIALHKAFCSSQPRM
jgi:DNA-binding transcriptional ArsR family regulator